MSAHTCNKNACMYMYVGVQMPQMKLCVHITTYPLQESCPPPPPPLKIRLATPPRGCTACCMPSIHPPKFLLINATWNLSIVDPTGPKKVSLYFRGSNSQHSQNLQSPKSPHATPIINSLCMCMYIHTYM